MTEELTFPGVYPKYLLPVYPFIEQKLSIKKEIGQKYAVSIENKEGEMVDHHEAICISRETMGFDDVPVELLALDVHTNSVEKAKETIFDNESRMHSSRKQVYVNIFMRLDKTREFVMAQWEELYNNGWGDLTGDTQ